MYSLKGVSVSVGRGSLCLSVWASLRWRSVRGAVNACPGNKGLVWRRRAEEQEVNSWLACCAEQDVPCVSAQRQIERRRTGRERSRESAAGWTRAIVSVYESLFVLLKLSIQKTSRLYLLFSFPSLLFGNKTSAQYHRDTALWDFKGCVVSRSNIMLRFEDVLAFFLAPYNSQLFFF